MIVEVMTATITPGKRQEAGTLLKKGADIINKAQQSGLKDSVVMVPYTGQLHKIHLVTTYETISGPKEMHDRLKDDADWQVFWKEYLEKQYTVMGSRERSIYEIVE